MKRYDNRIRCDIRDFECLHKINKNVDALNDLPNSYQKYCEEKKARCYKNNDYSENKRHSTRAEISNQRNYEIYRDYDDEYNSNIQRSKNKKLSNKVVMLNIVSIIMFLLVGIMTIYNVRIDDNANKINEVKETVIIDESRLNITSDGESMKFVSPVFQVQI